MPPQQGVFAVPVAALPQQQQPHSQQSYGQSEPTLLNDVLTTPDDFPARRHAAQAKTELPRCGGYQRRSR